MKKPPVTLARQSLSSILAESRNGFSRLEVLSQQIPKLIKKSRLCNARPPDFGLAH